MKLQVRHREFIAARSAECRDIGRLIDVTHYNASRCTRAMRLRRDTERASCIELGSRRRIFKSGISSGSSDPEIGVPAARGALGSGRKRCRRDRYGEGGTGMRESHSRRSPATRGGRLSGDERRAKGGWSTKRMRKREVSSYRVRRLLADNRFPGESTIGSSS